MAKTEVTGAIAKLMEAEDLEYIAATGIGSVIYVIAVYDENGDLVGYVPVYDTYS